MVAVDHMNQRPRMGTLLLFAVGSSVLLGLAARLSMRFVALESGMAGAFSFGGSLEVIVLGIMIGAPLALLFLTMRRHVAMPAPFAGVLYGVAVFSFLTLVPLPAARSALASTPDPPSATAGAFGLVFVAWGIALEFLSSHVEKRARQS